MTHSSRGQPFVVGDPHQQEVDVAGHIVPTVRKQRYINVDTGKPGLYWEGAGERSRDVLAESLVAFCLCPEDVNAAGFEVSLCDSHIQCGR